MSESTSPSRRPSKLRNIGCIAGLLLLGGCGVWLGFAVRDAREATRKSQCEGCLNQLQLALQSYHEAYGSYPPAFVADSQGRPIHSWRVLILPFIDGMEVYKKYDFSQPWDSPKNQQLALRISPHMLHCPSGARMLDSALTDYVVVTGEGTAFPYDKSTTREDFKDGLENTILLVEIANSGIHWMEPRDLDWKTMSFRVNDPKLPSISAPHAVGPVVVFGDRINSFSSGPPRRPVGRVLESGDWLDGYRLSDTLRPETVKALLTINGGELVTRKSLERWDQRTGRQLAE